VGQMQPMERRLTRRMQLILGAFSTLSAAYAFTWQYDSHLVSSSIAIMIGQEHYHGVANNVIMLLIFWTLLIFLAVLFPDDLDSAEARKVIGVMLALSDISGIYVFCSTTNGYTVTRSEGAASSLEKRVCLYIHYCLLCFFFFWGVVYPTWTYFFLHNSWRRLRCGLVVDACAFYLAIAMLWWFGEEKYPPGDAPLLVVLLGRPAIALFSAATFNPATRCRLAAWGKAAGILHVKLSLDELRHDEIRQVLGTKGFGKPVACGNLTDGSYGGSALLSAGSVDDAPISSEANELSHQSHHTAKIDTDNFQKFHERQSPSPRLAATSTQSGRAPGGAQSDSSDATRSFSAGSLGSEMEGLRRRPLGFEANVGERYWGESPDGRSPSKC